MRQKALNSDRKVEFLLEIGCEEIPADQLLHAATQLLNLITKKLQAERITFTGLDQLFTPRRLVVLVKGLVPYQEDLIETVIGPPKEKAFDEDRKPTQAAIAFAKKNNVQVKSLRTLQTAKGEYVGIEKKTKGEKSSEILAKALPEIIGSVSFPKNMYWGEDRFRFARPIRWILAILDHRVIKFEIAGIKSGNKTYGNMILKRKAFSVNSFSEYKTALKKAYVIVDPLERNHIITKELASTAKKLGGELIQDQELKELVVNLNEHPRVLGGQIDTELLNLPKEVLMTVMKQHQKYFSIQDRAGNLMPYFLTVANTTKDYKGDIVKGHERVLRARLKDANFFWQMDRRIELRDRLVKLRNVLFHQKLGTYYEKTDRLIKMASALADDLGLAKQRRDIEDAARLCKTDLTSEIVKEFPTLQGIMGGLYAREEGYTEKIWRSIYEHYLPRNVEENSPSMLEGAAVSLADKLDTIVGCFAIGLAPTGSKDPFALRRLGTSLIKIILDHGLGLSIRRAVGIALEHLMPLITASEGQAIAEQQLNDLKANLVTQLRHFFEGRLRYVLEYRGFKYDEINAGLAAGFDKPYHALKRIASLSKIRSEEDFLAIATAFKRIKNIIRGQDTSTGTINTDLLEETAERNLYGLLEEVKPRIYEYSDQLDYYSALKLIASMRKTVDHFFDKVLVMTENTDLRKNRITLLNEIAEIFRKVADISEIVVESSASEGMAVKGQAKANRQIT